MEAVAARCPGAGGPWHGPRCGRPPPVSLRPALRELPCAPSCRAARRTRRCRQLRLPGLGHGGPWPATSRPRPWDGLATARGGSSSSLGRAQAGGRSPGPEAPPPAPPSRPPSASASGAHGPGPPGLRAPGEGPGASLAARAAAALGSPQPPGCAAALTPAALSLRCSELGESGPLASRRPGSGSGSARRPPPRPRRAPGARPGPGCLHSDRSLGLRVRLRPGPRLRLARPAPRAAPPAPRPAAWARGRAAPRTKGGRGGSGREGHRQRAREGSARQQRPPRGSGRPGLPRPGLPLRPLRRCPLPCRPGEGTRRAPPFAQRLGRGPASGESGDSQAEAGRTSERRSQHPYTHSVPLPSPLCGACANSAPLTVQSKTNYPILQMRKLKPREDSRLAQGQWQSRNETQTSHFKDVLRSSASAPLSQA